MNIRFRFALTIIGLILSLMMHSQIAYSSKVRLHGIVLDSTVTFLQITRPTPFWWAYNAEHVTAEVKPNDNSNSFDLSFELDRPMQLWVKSSESTWPIFCTPGDEVSFVISRNPHDKRYLIIKFDGQNSAQYNVINELDDLGFRFSYPVFRGDALAYRAAVDAWLGEKEKLFDNYKNQFQTNTAFLDYFTSTISYDRLNLLYRPLWSEKISLADLPRSYLDGTQVLTFDNEMLLDNTSFREALVSKYLYVDDPKMRDNFDELYKDINAMKAGKIKEYLTACLIGIYVKHEAPQNEKGLSIAIHEALKTMKYPEHLEFIAETQKNYLKLNRVFPDSIQNTTFVISLIDNKKITLKEMLAIFKDQAMYIHFWAQSCAPCLQDIRESMEAKDLLNQEKIAYVYFSIDKETDIEKWSKASTKDGITINQYLLIDGSNSPLANYLQADYIPRYVLVDESHQLKKTLAPRPVSNQLPALARKIKEMRTKVVTYK